MKITDFKSFVGGWALDIQEISIEPGHITLIHGPSGSGKTSFFQGLIGLNAADYNLDINGKNLAKLKPVERNYSVVFQSNNLFEHLSVKKNLELIRPKAQSQSEFMDSLKHYNIEALLTKTASVLSGGEKQMVSCVRSFLHKDRSVMLLDEPWSSMDFDNKCDYRAYLIDFLKYNEIPCILISHDKDEEISFLNPKFIYDFTQIARFEKGQLLT